MEIQNQSNMTQSTRHQHALVRPLAPEDLVPGLYVTVMSAAVECWPCACTDEWKSAPVTHASIPGFAGLPLRVAGVCIPFVLLQTPIGTHWTCDVRRYRLAQLSDRFGHESFKRYADDKARRDAKQRDDDDDDD